jgi:hypothetical protein
MMTDAELDTALRRRILHLETVVQMIRLWCSSCNSRSELKKEIISLCNKVMEEKP